MAFKLDHKARLEEHGGNVKGTIIDMLPNLVKGVGFKTGSKPLGEKDGAEILDLTTQLEQSMLITVKKSHGAGGVAEVTKSINPVFGQQFGLFQLGLDMAGGIAQDDWSAISQTVKQVTGKSITTTSPLSTGLVPYDLLEPTKIITPYDTVIRNKVPRTQGQGLARRLKLLTGFSGSHTNGSNLFTDITTSELSSFATPNALPNFGSQQSSELAIGYKQLIMTEALTWLAQYAGQGFDDLASLINLILLMEFTLNEEGQMLYATNSAIVVPSEPTALTARTPGSGETGLSGIAGSTIYVVVTAGNELGETTASAAITQTVANGQVADLFLAALPTGQAYTNVYIGTGTTNSGVYYRMASYLGGIKITLQGALPVSGATPPTADTGTYAATRYEGFLPVLSGHSVTGGVYPTGWQGGYINQNVGDVLNGPLVATALKGMYDSNNANGGFRADPTNIIAEATDLANFSNDILTNGHNQAYSLRIAQDEVANITAGGAVSSFINPFTHTMVETMLHPYLRQGTAMLASWVVSHPNANVGATVENVFVQDLMSIKWPITDMAFKFSIFAIGALVFQAPQYWGLLQGLQVSNTHPYS